VKSTTWHTIRTTTIFIPLSTYDHIGPQTLIHGTHLVLSPLCIVPLSTYDHIGPQTLIHGTHLVLSPLCIVVDVIMQELWFFNSPCAMYYITLSTPRHTAIGFAIMLYALHSNLPAKNKIVGTSHIAIETVHCTHF
jgi:hypothetical protein